MTQVTQQAQALQTQIQAFAAKIKEISKAAQNAENAQNAERLEGLTLNEVVELIAGTVGLTTQQVKDELDAFIAREDNPHNVTAEQVGLGDVENFGMASSEEALNTAEAARYMSPQRVWEVMNHFWADKVGTAPETLDTIEEIAAAISNNQDTISAINDAIANKARTDYVDGEIAGLQTQINDKASTEALNGAVDLLQQQITAAQESADGVTAESLGLDNVQNFGIATQEEAEAGTSNEAYMTPLRTKQAQDLLAGEVADAFALLADTFEQATFDLDVEEGEGEGV